MKKALIIGLGQSGRAAADVLLLEGYQVFAADAFHETLSLQQWFSLQDPSKVHKLQDRPVEDIASYALAIVSPGIAKDHPLYKQVREAGIPCQGEAEFALQKLHQKSIGITGSNGKTTLAVFLEHLLHEGGYSAKAIGNVGFPFSKYLLQQNPSDILVAELSSFQLETLTSPVFDYTVLLDILPNHLDRHSSFEEYALTKLRLLRCMKSQGIAFVHPHVLQRFHSEIEKENRRIIPIFSGFSFSYQDSYLQHPLKREYCHLMEIVKEKALGDELFYLAVAFSHEFSISHDRLLDAVKTFKKPPHRLEFVAKLKEVRFVNDSKATTPEAVLHAVKTVQGKICLIVGGKNKGLSFDAWRQGLKPYVEQVIAIGESKELIRETLGAWYDVILCHDLEEAVDRGWKTASPGSTLLLSPGCASYDQYKDYLHRGEHFKEIVTALGKRDL